MTEKEAIMSVERDILSTIIEEKFEELCEHDNKRFAKGALRPEEKEEYLKKQRLLRRQIIVLSKKMRP